MEILTIYICTSLFCYWQYC